MGCGKMHRMIEPAESVGRNASGELVIFNSDTSSRCVYLPDQEAQLPVQIPLQSVSRSSLDWYLENGYRRSGRFFYRTACPSCVACEPTRVWVDKFQVTRSMRRVLNKAKDVTIKIGPPTSDASRLALFNRHRKLRNLNTTQEAYSESDFASFLVATACPTVELSFWVAETLVGCTIMDVGDRSVSAVYTFFDPDYSKLSLGTLDVLKQIQWAQENLRPLAYLGMYVRENNHLNYKARFRPQERFRNQTWQEVVE